MVAIHLLTLVGFTRIAELFPVLAPLHLGKLAFALGGLTLAVSASRITPPVVWRTPLLRQVLLLLLLAALSVPFSVWRAGALESFQGVAKTVFIFVALAVMSRRDGGAMLRLALMIGVSLLSGMMLVEKGTGRAFVSATYDANDLALLFAMFLPVLGAEGLAGRWVVRLAAWGAAAMALVAMTMTQSRGGLVALAVMGLHMVLASRRRLPLLALLLLAGGIFYASADASFWDRFAILGDADADYNVSARTGRLELWKSGLAMMLSNPLLGVGVGQFAPANFMYGNGAYLTAHNTYIQVATEMGLAALVVYCSLLLTVARLADRGISPSRPSHPSGTPPETSSEALPEAPPGHEDLHARAERLRWLGVRYALTAFMTGICFVSEAFSMSFFCLLALVAAMAVRLEEREAASGIADEPQTPAPEPYRRGRGRGGAGNVRPGSHNAGTTLGRRRSPAHAAIHDPSGR